MITFTAADHRRCDDDQVPGVRHRWWGVHRSAHRDHRREGERAPDRHGRTSAPCSAPACRQCSTYWPTISIPTRRPAGCRSCRPARCRATGRSSPNGRLVTITPNPGFVGSLVATYTIRDGAGPRVDRPGDPQRAGATQPPARGARRQQRGRQRWVDHHLGVVQRLRSRRRSIVIDITSGPDSSLGAARLNNDGSIAFTAAPGASGTAVIGYDGRRRRVHRQCHVADHRVAPAPNRCRLPATRRSRPATSSRSPSI